MKPEFAFDVGETVRIKSGAFTAFTGKVKKVDHNERKLKVLVSIFGRDEPIELGFSEIEKLNLTREDN